eukprot:jgi/Phyca11/70908/gw1.15.504.1
MVGVSASQLPPETLRPGDVLEYYSQAFVCGDRRGHRVGVVLKISGTRNDPYPVTLDTQETLPMTNMVRRRFDIAGTALFLDRVQDGGEDGEGDAVDGEDNSTSTGVPLSPPWSRNKLRRIESIVEAEVTDAELRAATEFVETVPTRWQRQKRRHQKKVMAGEWTQPRSRKRRH